MSFQLLDIAIYSHAGERRVLSLKLGAVNVITGASKTGKTALIDIVDYCLGRTTFTIPAGVIRDAVSWFVIRIQAPSNQVVIGRPTPSNNARSNSEVHLAIGGQLDLPSFSELKRSTNTSALEAYLTELAGIATNEHIPEGLTRPALRANISHAKYLLFQPQNRIADKSVLFYRQEEDFIPQAIKDTLPYFLGAVNEEHFDRMQELRRARRELKLVERRLADEKSIEGRDNSRALALLAEAQRVGILSTDIPVNDADGISIALESCLSWNAQMPDITQESPLEPLRQERDRLLEKLSQLLSEVATARAFAIDQDDFSRELQEQRHRLHSLNLFPESDKSEHRCPLCEQQLSASVPSANDLGRSLRQLDAQMEAVLTQRPRLSEYLREREDEIADTKRHIVENRAAIDAVVAKEEELQLQRSLSESQARVAGRISLFVESVNAAKPSEKLDRAVKEARERVSVLEAELSRHAIDSRLESCLRIISNQMSEWARRLKLEHSEFPIELNIADLTVVAFRDSGPVPMSEMGSGENWVGYHILTHLALHEWFVKKGRPVPHFLMLDQPTQVYFPSDRTEGVDYSLDDLPSDEDREAVQRMFKLCFDVVKSLAPGLQIIIMDHADLTDPWFQEAVVERWRGGMKLVPDSWYK